MFGSTSYTVIAVCCMFAFLKGADANLRSVLAYSGTATWAPRVSAPSQGDPVTCDNQPNDEEAAHCCTEHAQCPDFIPPKSTKYGIDNSKDEKLYSCSCETEFLGCLLRASEKSNSNLYEELGTTYFGGESRQCFNSIYKSICEGPYFDKSGKEYDDNISEKYFCARLQTVRFYEGSITA